MGKPATFEKLGHFDFAIDEDGKHFPIWVADIACRVKSAKLLPGSTVNKADTNYNTYSLMAGASTTVASIANGPNSSAGTSFTAGTEQDLTVTETDLAVGDELWVKSVKQGNGLAMNEVTFQVVIEALASAVG
jgi:hypothetical protein